MSKTEHHINQYDKKNDTFHINGEYVECTLEDLENLIRQYSSDVNQELSEKYKDLKRKGILTGEPIDVYSTVGTVINKIRDISTQQKALITTINSATRYLDAIAWPLWIMAFCAVLAVIKQYFL